MLNDEIVLFEIVNKKIKVNKLIGSKWINLSTHSTNEKIDIIDSTSNGKEVFFLVRKNQQGLILSYKNNLWETKNIRGEI